MMADHKKSNIQIVIWPYHSQGHMNTMLQFAKRLAWKGANITIATTISTTKNIQANISSWKTIAIESIHDDSGESYLIITDRMARFEASAASNLAQLLITKKQQSHNKKCLLVYHSSLHWAQDVAKQHGVANAVFFTQACASISCYYSLLMESQGKQVAELPGILPTPYLIQKKLPPQLAASGLFSNHNNAKVHPVVLWLAKDYANAAQADFVLVNSFDKLEKQVVDWMSNIWPVKTIGPTLPSAYLDKQVKNDINYGFNQYKPSNEACMNWLNTKPAGSVVYIAFGSVAHLSAAQLVEIAEALKQSTFSFLWAIRESEQEKLPVDFIGETSDKGLVLPWCPQLDVLAHQAVGCFMSHCGWNSTIEALCFGVPVLAMPQFLDQVVDTHLVEQVWGVGIAPMSYEKGLVTRENIENGLAEIMDGKKAKKIKDNATLWKGLAKEAWKEGGSSDKHIDEIIEWLASA